MKYHIESSANYLTQVSGGIKYRILKVEQAESTQLPLRMAKQNM